ncbi:DUF1801 domain-containing protein [Oleiharenicola lentus]|uniref:DUF1801 domain-containing protein n=1 Tax=Oleiharenicola lentus TaxID=2508720 RepID=UPI003F67EB2E
MQRFKDSSVASVFAGYPQGVRIKLMELRELVFSTAAEAAEVGPLKETLKWRQPSYLTELTNSGSTIRMDAITSGQGEYALYFNCQTTLVADFRTQFGSLFRYEGNRALLFNESDVVPARELRRCIAEALTYHLRKRHHRLTSS